jgi:hypothetical protein
MSNKPDTAAVVLKERIVQIFPNHGFLACRDVRHSTVV